MLGDFSYSNPTKLYFGEHSLEGLRKELPPTAKTCCWSTAAALSGKMGSTTVSS